VGFVIKASVAKLGPNLIMFRFKVGTNGVLCLLDSRTTHSFVNPSAIKRFGWVATKVAKPIKVHLTQGAMTLASEVVLKVVLECGKAKFAKNFMVYTLNGMEAILGNTFLNVYLVNVLKGSSKVKVIC
jgi:hypothetical protein